MVRKVIMNFDLSKTSGCIPLVVVKNCQPELCYIIAELFNKCLKESCFPDSRSLGLLELWHLIYSRLLAGFGMLVFFTILSLMEFHVRYLALFLFFSVVDNFKWFWMEK